MNLIKGTKHSPFYTTNWGAHASSTVWHFHTQGFGCMYTSSFQTNQPAVCTESHPHKRMWVCFADSTETQTVCRKLHVSPAPRRTFSSLFWSYSDWENHLCKLEIAALWVDKSTAAPPSLHLLCFPWVSSGASLDLPESPELSASGEKTGKLISLHSPIEYQWGKWW